jgi:RNA polymerase sigma factor (sigma-70 family)
VALTDASLRDELAGLHEASYGWALACCRWNRSEAEDVLHSVYLKIFEGSARFDGRSSLRTWLFAVIRRTTAERRRREVLGAVFAATWLRSSPEPDESPDPLQVLEEREDVARLRAALLTLSSRQRELLSLVFYHGTSVDEAASILGIKAGSARTHYHRAKARLRVLLGQQRA